ncbi:MAG: ankyrin repeat domain-containing protein [Alphaproteobacteria bacterium]
MPNTKFEKSSSSLKNRYINEKLIYYNGNFCTLLQIAAAKEEIETLSFLIKHGVDVNQQNNKGDTALHLSARNLKFKSVHELLKAGANPNIKNKDGKTAFTEADQRQIDPVYLYSAYLSSTTYEGISFADMVIFRHKDLDPKLEYNIKSIMLELSAYGAQVRPDLKRIGLHSYIDIFKKYYENYKFFFNLEVFQKACDVIFTINYFKLAKDSKKEILSFYAPALNPHTIDKLINFQENIKDSPAAKNEVSVLNSQYFPKVQRFVKKAFSNSNTRAISNQIKEILYNSQQISWQNKIYFQDFKQSLML